MAQFTVNTNRFDPYKNFKFRVKWDGRRMAGFSQVGADGRKVWDHQSSQNRVISWPGYAGKNVLASLLAMSISLRLTNVLQPG
jgi:hypothetical protein